MTTQRSVRAWVAHLSRTPWSWADRHSDHPSQSTLARSVSPLPHATKTHLHWLVLLLPVRTPPLVHRWSLTELAQRITGVGVAKGETLSDWEAAPLSDSQLVYDCTRSGAVILIAPVPAP